MDSSSKKVVMFIFAVALGIIAVMAYNDYNRPAVENPTPVAAPEPAPVMAEPSAAPIQTSSPAGTFSANEDIPAINGEPSMKLQLRQ